MENLEKKALLAEKIKCTSRHACRLASMALRFNACLENIPSWSGMCSTPSECAACFYLDDLKTLVGHIEASFSDLRNFIDENY